jgi:hypothetical protein
MRVWLPLLLLMLASGCLASFQAGAVGHVSREGVALGGSASTSAGAGFNSTGVLLTATGWAGRLIGKDASVGGMLFGPRLDAAAREVKLWVALLGGPSYFPSATTATFLVSGGLATELFGNKELIDHRAVTVGVEVRAGIDVAQSITAVGFLLLVVNADVNSLR